MPAPAAPLGILFDMDGVLLNSGDFHRRAWYRYAEQAGFVMDDRKFWESFGKTNATIFREWFGAGPTDAELERMSERKEALFREEARGRLGFFPGVPEALRRLKTQPAAPAQGQGPLFRLALGTSTPRSNLDFFRAELGMDAFFEAFTCANEVLHGKPAPDIFLLAARKVAVPPERCVVIEDSFHGLEAAKRAGMKCVGIASTHTAEALRADARADAILSATEQLTPELLLGLW